MWDIVLGYFLPFLIFFAIIYTFFQMVPIFGNPKKSQLARKMNVIISLAIAALVLMYQPLGVSWAEFFSRLFGTNIAAIIGLSLFVLFTIMFSAARMESHVGALSLVVGVVLAVLAIMNAGLIPASKEKFHFFDISIEAIIILIATIGVIYGMYHMFSSSGEKMGGM